MSGFSTDWLALREPADHRARSTRVQDSVVAAYATSGTLRITDLGCGAGSNLRALAPVLPHIQHWRLVDYDCGLLAAAAEALRHWADESRDRPDGLLELKIGDRQLTVSFEQADLSSGLAKVLAMPCDLVTAAAFFDLVSLRWIRDFVTATVVGNLPLYTVLTYDGRETWHPPHPADAAVLAAFHAHQASDKGFGAAAGPAAGPALVSAYRERGWTVVSDDSPWRLGRADADLIEALALGCAAAVEETGTLSSPELASWTRSRRDATSCEIGHIDLFAVPPAGGKS